MERTTFRILMVATFLLMLIVIIDGDRNFQDHQRVRKHTDGESSSGSPSNEQSGSKGSGSDKSSDEKSESKGSGSDKSSDEKSESKGSGSEKSSDEKSESKGSGSDKSSDEKSESKGSGSDKSSDEKSSSSGSSSNKTSDEKSESSGSGSDKSSDEKSKSSSSSSSKSSSGSSESGSGSKSKSRSKSGSSSGSDSGEPDECFDGICPCDCIDDNDAPGTGPDFNCSEDEDQCSMLMYYLKMVLLRLISVIDMWRAQLFALRCYLVDYIDYLKDADCEQVLCAITTGLKDILAYLCIYY
ncbi:uncharacterized protein LOC100378180 [Saccoglossus kowalevskii]|uniref:Dentin sialophosphoprotein-like n=1 Tax=Saccoglossus kowalevskii TaxID=10224 RepID=A0ABM0GVB3_SACKO|nr:PREDICTED: dentin sialophosphoprotein-like [Saccoglossus kowalevskii]